MKKLLVILSLLLGTTFMWGQSTLYVSPVGKDTNKGTLQDPFKTLERARDEARNRKKTGRAKVSSICLRGGVYRFTSPFVLTAEDSGQKGSPIVYTSYKDEKVMFSGSRLLTPTWKKYNDSIWVASVTLAEQQGFSPRTLYINGEICPLSRYPNRMQGVRPFEGVAADCLSPERVSRWKSAEGGYVHGMQQGKWGSIHYKILGVSDNGTPHLELISIDTSTMYNGAQLHSKDRYVENIFEELDAPGEWFWDRKTKQLYIYPPKGTDLNKAVIEVPATEQIVRLEGDEKQPVCYVEFRGIRFEKTLSTWFRSSEHLPVGDYVICRDAVVYMEGTVGCKIENCRFNDIGGNGVMLSKYNRNSSVCASRFENIQANGIVLVGSRDAMRDTPWCEVTPNKKTVDLTKRWGYILTYSIWNEPLRDTSPSTDTIPGPKTENYPRYCLVENNLITRIGELEKQAAGVLLSMCAENRINHNSIYDVPRAGICINDGSWGGQIIENNDVFHTVLSTADHGPFNSWGRDRHWTMKMHGVVKQGDEKAHDRSRLDNYIPTIIRHNRFGHTVNNHSFGIDLDDGSSNYQIYDNLTIGCSVKLREGFFRLVENNIFIGKYPPGKHVCFQQTEDVMRKNIYVNTESNVAFEGIHSKPSQVKEIDYNLYFTLTGDPMIVKLAGEAENGYKNLMSMEQWQMKGHDRHSIVADPMFVDIEKGDFRLQPNSPAFKLGFKEFCLTNFGTEIPEFKAETVRAHQRFDSLVLSKKTRTQHTKLVKWMGALIKTMDTDAEKSVAGIDDIKGVIMVEVPETCVLYRMGVRKGDVILSAAGKDIKNMTDLNRAIGENKKNLKIWVDGNPPAHFIQITSPESIIE